MAIYLHNDDIEFPPINTKATKLWIKKVVEHHKYKLGELNYIFTSDKQILSINNEYLKHNYFTAVITFDFTEGDVISGDIFVSLDTVKSNSEKFDQEYLKELNRVIIHGVLHLVGYKDKTKAEAKEMREQEDIALKFID